MALYEVCGTIVREIRWHATVEAENEAEAAQLAKYQAEQGEADEQPDGSEVMVDEVELVTTTKGSR